jgi:Ca2+-transporting ATPase
MTLAFAQLFHLANARSDEPLAGLTHMSNPYAVGGLLLSIVLQLIAMYVTPLARVLGVETLDAQGWFVVMLFAAIPAMFGQASKIRWRRTGANRR